MKKMFLMALAALSLASCSNDEVLEIKQNAITFDVVSDNASRASTLYSNAVKPEKFIVYAVHNKTNADKTVTKTMYIDGVTVKKSGTSYVFEDGASRYWPAEGTLTFYAIVEPDYKYDGENKGFTKKTVSLDNISYTMCHPEALSGQSSIGNFNEAIADQQDFIYAVKDNQTKTEDGKVSLNFRHAYSQIVFNGKIAENKKLYVKVNEIYVQDLYVLGEFTLPSLSTDDNVLESTENGVNKLYNQGEWTILTQPKSCGYKVIPSNKLISSTTAVTLTSGSTALLLIPQKSTDTHKIKLKVNCDIYNVAGDTFNEATDQEVYSGDVDLEPEFEWKQGLKYVYTLIFDGNKLKPISFTVTVDDYIPGDSENVTVY